MKLGALFAGYLSGVSTFFGFNTPKGPQEHAICVNTVTHGIFTYNDDATRQACSLINSEKYGTCSDCKIVEKDSIYCNSPNVRIDHSKFEQECKNTGAEKALSN